MNQEQLLYKLTQIGIALCKERDIQKLLSKILTEACSFTNAEGGSLYIRKDKELLFMITQNNKLPENTTHKCVLTGKRIPLTTCSVAGYVGITGKLVNIEDAYEIPDTEPYKIDRRFDEQNNYRTRSMLVAPMQESGNNPIGVLALINAKNNDKITTFSKNYEPLVACLASQAAVAIRNAQLTRDLKDACLDTIMRLSKAAECKDTDTANHIERISYYSSILAETMGFPEHYIETMRYASPMHDVGKIGVADAILLKPGKLTNEEYEEMQKHTTLGATILSNSKSEILKMSEEIALTHHERFDGTGYPKGLKGEQIPPSGRIVAVADVFDALLSKRCYKTAWELDEVVSYIKKGAGKHFDPDVVSAFEKCLDQLVEVKNQFVDLV